MHQDALGVNADLAAVGKAANDEFLQSLQCDLL